MNGLDIHVRFRNDDELIVSPQRKKRRTGLRSGSNRTTSTPKTPRTRLNHSVVESPSVLNSPRLNDSVLSGYDGDREDDLDDSIITDGKHIVLIHLFHCINIYSRANCDYGLIKKYLINLKT